MAPELTVKIDNFILSHSFLSSKTYIEGDIVLYKGTWFIFKPNEEQPKFSTNIYPNEGKGWIYYSTRTGNS